MTSKDAWSQKATHGKEKRAGANTACKREIIAENAAKLKAKNERFVAETFGIQI